MKLQALVALTLSVFLSFSLQAAPPDDDGDGLSNNEENNTYGTDPNNADTDGDLLFDGEEVLVYGTDPLNTDTDGDSVPDGTEIDFGSDPLVFDPDTDGDGTYDHVDSDDDNDGMPDWWEESNGLNSLYFDSTLDPDNDRLSNLGEYRNGYNPWVVDNDSDFDGVNDLADTDDDNDGWSDEDELACGSDPLLNTSLPLDTDADSYCDQVDLFPADPAKPVLALGFKALSTSWDSFYEGASLVPYIGSQTRMTKVGDVNQDGFEDVLLGLPGSSALSRRAVIRSGKEADDPYNEWGLGQDKSIFQFDGSQYSPLYGGSVAAAGDVNGDGYDDFLVGDPGLYGGAKAGKVLVYSGFDYSLLYEVSDDVVEGRFGYSLSGGWDVNQDGFDDWIVGAPSSSKAYIYSGADGSLISEHVGVLDTLYGSSVAWIGDINADTYPDWVVSAYSSGINGANSGDIFVYSGADGTQLYGISGDAAGDELGVNVSLLGDVNNDSYLDFAATAWDSLSAGSYARVYSGVDGSVLHAVSGESIRMIKSMGDLNGDGYDDWVVGGNGVKVYSGFDGGLMVAYRGGLLASMIDGVNYCSEDLIGRGLSVVGDNNNDGRNELMVQSMLKDCDNESDDDGRTILLSVELLLDSDGEGWDDNYDNCPLVENFDQLDQDGDGAGDVCDTCYLDGASSTATDTDGDGLCDDFADTDDDNDGLTDSEEIALGTWVRNPDTDSDGMTDGWEVDNGLDPKANDASGDPDVDGYTNLQEFNNGTDPNVWDDPPVLLLNSTADTDGDGDSDILWQNTIDGNIVIWDQQGFANNGTTTVGGLGVNYVLADTADLDADGDSDLILFDGDPAAGLALRWEMENHAKVSGAKLAGFPGWQFKGTGDFDGDGDGDIVWQSENGLAASDGTVIVWIMENNAKVSGSSLGRHEFGARVVAIGDFDNDSDADIMQSIPSGPALIRWDFENGSKVAGASIGGFVGYTVKAVGDFNKDDTDDILWEPDAAGQAIIWLMQNGSKNSGTGVGLLTNYDIETVGDYDGDADADILWKNANGHVIIWEIENAAKAAGYSVDTFDADHDVKP